MKSKMFGAALLFLGAVLILNSGILFTGMVVLDSGILEGPLRIWTLVGAGLMILGFILLKYKSY